jgi:hypothetical protein
VNPPYSWTTVETTNAAALRAGTSTQDDGSAAATFTTIGVGVGALMATDNPDCHDCEPPSLLWQVTVTVVSTR